MSHIHWVVRQNKLQIPRDKVYNESRKWELKKRRKNEDRCDERLKTKAEEDTWLTCTGLHEELKHLKIKTRLINTKFENVMGEYAI
jgi:hypothetical protein